MSSCEGTGSKTSVGYSQSDTGGGEDGVGESESSTRSIAAEVTSCHNDDCSAKSATCLCFMYLE
eukprot:12917547-Prorocentrum_lima.AAC.1